MATFGNTVPGASTSALSNYLEGGHYAPTKNGIVTDIQVYVQNLDSVAHYVYAALYVYLGPGNPGTVIAYTTGAAIAAGTSAWVVCPFSPGVAVTAGTQYFLMAEDNDGGLENVYYTAGGASGIDAFYTPRSGAPPYWPNLTGLCTSSTAERSIYADYIPSPTGQVYGDGLTSYTC